MNNLIFAKERLYYLCSALMGAMVWGLSSPCCTPLRALAWGYDCIALRAISLRDVFPLRDDDSLCQIMQSFEKISMTSKVFAFTDDGSYCVLNNIQEGIIPWNDIIHHL